MHRIQENKVSSTKDTGPLVFLSLFLLLLAFFILLNALSTIEETKSKKVLTSVAATFRSVADADTSAQVLVSDLGPTPDPEELVAAMRQLWVTAIAVTRVDTLTAGQVMQMTFPANELFLGGQPVLRTDRESLFENVARALTLRANGAVSELQLVLGSGAVTDAALRSGGTLATQRAAAMADSLVDHGAPADTISVGIRVGDPKTMRLRFAVRASSRAYVTFGELVDP